jgi:hypothetical protein
LERAREQENSPHKRKETNSPTRSRARQEFPRPETESTHSNLCVFGGAAAAAAEEVEEMLSGDIPPNQTIYLNNLNEKVKKEGTSLIRLHTPNSS